MQVEVCKNENGEKKNPYKPDICCYTAGYNPCSKLLDQGNKMEN